MPQEKPEENKQAYPADESMLTEQKEGHVSEPAVNVRRGKGCLYFVIIVVIIFILLLFLSDTFAILVLMMLLQAF